MSDEVEFEQFAQEMNDFEDKVVPKIENILKDEKYLIQTEVLGLVATARAIIVTYGQNDDEKQALIDTAILMLEKDF